MRNVLAIATLLFISNSVLPQDVPETSAPPRGLSRESHGSEASKDRPADSRASPDSPADARGDTLTAGYDKHFFIGTLNRKFLMQIYAKLQIRYIANESNQPPGTDEDVNGFQLRRTELYFKGHVFDPRLSYKVKVAASRKDGRVSLDDMYVGYKMAEGWDSRVGQFKIPFLREYLVSSGKQLAVERSYVNHVFGLGRSQGVQACHRTDRFCAAAMIHDGADAKNRDFLSDRVKVGLAGRGEWRLAGSWKQFDDFNAWSRNRPGILVGGAVDWELGQQGSGTDQPDILTYTGDLSLMVRGWGLFAAFVGQHVDGNGSAALPDVDQFGVVVQAGTFVVPDTLEVYGRYEHLALDGYLYDKRDSLFIPAADDSINLLTFGANYYLFAHRAKLSCDAVWVLDPLPGADTGAGLVESPEDDQVALRVQLQLYF